MLETGLSITALVLLLSTSAIPTPTPRVLAQQQYSLQNRYNNVFVNDIFSDNILLTLAYMRGIVKKGEKFSWDDVRTPFTYGFILKPGETFSFHDAMLDQYKKTTTQTTKAHFDSSEGFKSDGWLVGDGVCHLASFLKVVATHADLSVDSPTNHNFATIADVPKSDGVSIYVTPNNEKTSSLHNLYITNSQTRPVAFLFDYKNSSLAISIQEIP